MSNNLLIFGSIYLIIVIIQFGYLIEWETNDNIPKVAKLFSLIFAPFFLLFNLGRALYKIIN